jgi:hypothetical protein
VKKYQGYRYECKPKAQSPIITYIPSWGSKVALGIVVEPITVPADEKHFVLNISRGVKV